jgi:signal peptidase I
MVELLLGLCLFILLARFFAAEPYVVPTGSMAPTLLGLHSEVTCQSCSFTYALGSDDDGRVSEPVCPNCGQRGSASTLSRERAGDRVLVQKFYFDVTRPRRWEVAVFHFPGDPVQAYVKRVVGLPGETVRIIGGDVYVNGQIVRKSIADRRAMRILVYDSRFQPADALRFPRWSFRLDAKSDRRATGWSGDDQGFRHEAPDVGALPADDWLIYRHLDPARGRYGPVTDFYAYNGSALAGANEVSDLGVEAQVTLTESAHALLVALQSGADHFLVRIPVVPQGMEPVQLYRNGHAVALANVDNPLRRNSTWPRKLALDASVFDRRVFVSLDGCPLFDPFDFERDAQRAESASESPVAVGVSGGTALVSDLRIYRDIYYTSVLAHTPLEPHDRKAPVQLGPDEYFVLGDNSPVSNDSRFWSEGPIVRGSMLVGKPFLVHLPGETILLKVMGRSVCWVPDPRRIRYIR